MIDLNARRVLAERKRHRELLESLDKVGQKKVDFTGLEKPIEGLIEQADQGTILTALNIQLLQNIDEELSQLKEILSVKKMNPILTSKQVEAISAALQTIKLPEFPKNLTIDEIPRLIEEVRDLKQKINKLPTDRLREITGVVEVQNLKEYPSTDLTPVVKAIQSLEKDLRAVIEKISKPQKETKIENKVDLAPINGKFDELMDTLREEITFLAKSQEENSLRSVEVTNFPPQMVPQPVTKIDINPLRGEFKTTGVTVTTTPTKLPLASLSRRRSLIVFNNDASATLYIGGANVSSSGVGIGLPVPAQQYSPSLDCDPSMILYGIVATGSLTAITLESSNDYGTTSTSVGNL